MTVEARNQETPVPHAAQEGAERQFRSSWDFEGVKKATTQGPKLIAINQRNKRIILLRCVGNAVVQLPKPTSHTNDTGQTDRCTQKTNTILMNKSV